MNQINNLNYVATVDDKYISSVSFIEKKNFPRSVKFDEMSEEEFDAYWSEKDGLPQAVLLIKVTDPRWISHLTLGQEWDTTAHDE